MYSGKATQACKRPTTPSKLEGLEVLPGRISVGEELLGCGVGCGQGALVTRSPEAGQGSGGQREGGRSLGSGRAARKS
jgi:hypothetical protein